MNATISRRQFIRMSVHLTGLGAISLAGSACGGAAVAPTAVSTGKTFTFDITSDDTIKFNVSKLEAEVGSKITVNLANKSTDKRFNFVLAKPGKMLRVVTNGQAEGEATEYLKDKDEDVIAHTKFAGPGETVSITFDAPAPGEYPFFCTFPGYYTRLNGVLLVK